MSVTSKIAIKFWIIFSMVWRNRCEISSKFSSTTLIQKSSAEVQKLQKSSKTQTRHSTKIRLWLRFSKNKLKIQRLDCGELWKIFSLSRNTRKNTKCFISYWRNIQHKENIFDYFPSGDHWYMWSFWQVSMGKADFVPCS